MEKLTQNDIYVAITKETSFFGRYNIDGDIISVYTEKPDGFSYDTLESTDNGWHFANRITPMNSIPLRQYGIWKKFQSQLFVGGAAYSNYPNDIEFRVLLDVKQVEKLVGIADYEGGK